MEITRGISTCLTLEKIDLGLSPLPEQRCIRTPEPKHVQCSKDPSGGDDCILRRKGYNPNYTFEGRFSVTWMLSPFDLHPCREKNVTENGYLCPNTNNASKWQSPQKSKSKIYIYMIIYIYCIQYYIRI